MKKRLNSKYLTLMLQIYGTDQHSLALEFIFEFESHLFQNHFATLE